MASIEVVLRGAVESSLHHHLHGNAVFLCERLFAHSPSEETLNLLATCHFRSNNLQRVCAVLKNAVSPNNRYLLALSFYELGKYTEAESALTGQRAGLSVNDPTVEIPNGAPGCHLMGLICEKAQRRLQAIEYFSQCLRINPYIWDAYEGLCRLGADIPTEGFFGAHDYFGVLSQGGDRTNQTPASVLGMATPATARTAGNAPSTGGAGADTPMSAAPNPTGAIDFSSFATPSPYPGSTAPNTRPQTAGANLTPFTPQGSPIPDVGATPTPGSVVGGRAEEPAPPARKVHGRLFSDTAGSGTGPQPRRSTRLSFSNVKDDSNKGMLSIVVDEEDSTAARIGDSPGVVAVMSLFRMLGEGFRALSMYRCDEAVEVFQSLPRNQYNTGWVLCQVGRAFFEMVKHHEAELAFQAARKVEPHRLAGLEIYSTIMWHLKKKKTLCYLAQQVLEFDRLSPHAWCVVGNCFSLQKEHETALKFFQRAIQLDNNFTYAYTLSGHEYVANEDFEKAIACFRNAIRSDERHYNAWYGLGDIYRRQEKYELALYHFRKALSINPRNSVLCCHIGMVLHASHQYEDALDILHTAIEIDPKNPLARFHRANVLMGAEEYELALKELEMLKELEPREASVYLTIGKIYKRVGRLEDAMANFTIALDLDPKDTNQIKNAIDKIAKPDMDDEDCL